MIGAMIGAMMIVSAEKKSTLVDGGGGQALPCCLSSLVPAFFQFADEFWKAAVKEYRTLEGMDAWEVVDCPLHTKILDIIWAFKIKRFPDGLIKGFKGRVCA